MIVEHSTIVSLIRIEVCSYSSTTGQATWAIYTTIMWQLQAENKHYSVFNYYLLLMFGPKVEIHLVARLESLKNNFGLSGLFNDGVIAVQSLNSGQKVISYNCHINYEL